MLILIVTSFTVMRLFIVEINLHHVIFDWLVAVVIVASSTVVLSVNVLKVVNWSFLTYKLRIILIRTSILLFFD